MVSKIKKNAKEIPLKDEAGLTGIICPNCGRRAALLEIFRFDQISSKDKNGCPIFTKTVDFCEDYECECGAHFQVTLDASYIITDAPVVEESSFQEESSIILDLQHDSSDKLDLGEESDPTNRAVM